MSANFARPDDEYAYGQSTYVIKRKVFSLLGARASIFDTSGALLFFCKRKKLRLKEDIRIYADESMQREMLLIRARGVLDFGMTYDVVDARTQQPVGALRRKGLKSILRDEWHILAEGDRQIGTILEESSVLAVLRRLSNLVTLVSPQSYTIELSGRAVGSIAQNRNPFTLQYVMDLSGDANRSLDRRLAIAAAVLLVNVEGRQG